MTTPSGVRFDNTREKRLKGGEIEIDLYILI